MKLQNNGYWIILLLLLSVGSAFAQDLAFSQFYHTPFLTNPSRLVQDNQARILFNFRNQSLESGDNLSTTMLSATYPMAIRANLLPKFGLGFSLINDNAAGLLTTNGILFGGAYNQKLGSALFLSLGVQGGIFQRRIDADKITTDNQFLFGFFDPTADINEDLFNLSVSYFTTSAGLRLIQKDYMDRDMFYVGFTLHNLNTPEASFFQENEQNASAEIPQSIIATGGLNLYQGTSIVWMPNFRWVHRLGQNSVNIGSQVQFNFQRDRQFLQNSSLGLGAWYSSNNGFVFSAEFHQPRYWIGISYDLSTTGRANALNNAGVLELSMGLKFPRKSKLPPPIEDTLRPEIVTMQRLDARDSLIYEALEQWQYQGIAIAALNQRKPSIQKLSTQTLTENRFVRDTLRVEVRRIDVPDRDTVTVNTLRAVSSTLSDLDRVTLRKKIRFTMNSNDLSPTYQKNLDDIASLLLRNKSLRVMIVGHTCDVGSNEENLSLSRFRAESVKKYLVEKGVETTRLRVLGMGTGFPLVPNTNEYNRNINRRVEFKILPN